MDSSDLQRRHHQYSQQQQQQQQQTMSSGLMRYRSAPSSYFASLLNSGADGGGNCDEFLNHRPTSPETERILARLISADAAQDSSSHNLEQNPSQFMPSMKQETDNFHHQESSGYPSGSQMVYQNQSRPSLTTQNSAASNSITMDQMTQMKMGGGASNSNLIRHSSSPAGLFSHFNIENGYGVIGGGMGNFGGGGNGANTKASYPSTTRLNAQIDFSSGPPSSSGRMTPISENENKRMEMSDPNDRIFGEGHRNDRDYITGFPIGSWDDSVILSDNFLQRAEEDDKKAFSGMNASENQNAEVGNFPPPTVLSHHLSLPTSSAELSAMEKLLQFQDSVPCKIRAKRGCATHPRSIAERVRRTRISERMRKLQELVPNMDKQTNTADMLDLAVDYIKDLQRQVKTLSDNRAKCTCSNQQKLAQKA